jgi:hypothetical protein
MLAVGSGSGKNASLSDSSLRQFLYKKPHHALGFQLRHWWWQSIDAGWQYHSCVGSGRLAY